MNDDAKNYLYFSKVERNGVLFLFLLLVALLLLPFFYGQKVVAETSDFSEFKTEIADFEKYKTVKNQVTSQQRPTFTKKERYTREEAIAKEVPKPAISLFYFDPNTASKEELLSLGFSEKVAQRLIKYRATGAVFYKKEDVAKIYGLEEGLLAKVGPYMAFAVNEAEDKEEFKQKKIWENPENVTINLPKKELSTIAVNSASTEEWQSIYGIGPVLAERIIKFRDKLGGFNSLEQLGEVYGLPDSTLLKMNERLVLDETEIVKIDVNNSSKEELAAHPYLKWKQASIIVNYREQHGPYNSTEDLHKLRGIPKDQLEKVLPYMKFN